MCRVNDEKRNYYDSQIKKLCGEYINESTNIDNIENAKCEVQELVNEAQCVIDNLNNCDFGGNKIISSVKSNQEVYLDRIDYYDEYMIKCQETVDYLEKKINDLYMLMDALPINCGVCGECYILKNNGD